MYEAAFSPSLNLLIYVIRTQRKLNIAIFVIFLQIIISIIIVLSSSITNCNLVRKKKEKNCSYSDITFLMRPC